MESPDVIETSDVEEREVLVLSEDVDYLVPSTPRMSMSYLDMHPPSATTENDHQCCPISLSSPITRHDRHSDSDAENPPPRKRIKVAHNASPDFATPAKGEGEEQASLHGVSPRSDWHSLFSSPSRPAVDRNSTERIQPQNKESPSTQLFLSHSLSVPTDLHSPSISPHCHSTTPPQMSSRHSDNQSSPGRRKTQLTSSPLTPVSSPVVISHTPSQSPDPLRLPSPRRPHSATSSVPLANSQPVHSPLVEIPDDSQPLGRYALRRREARQLNPYAYDKIMYKRQLRFHPDAIVKFRSPRRQSGMVAGDGTQDEFVFPFSNPSEDGDYVDVGPEDGRSRRVQSPARNNEFRGNGQGHEARQMDEGWLPEILKELSSSDEDDDEIHKLAKRIRREREKEKATARAEARRIAAKARQAEKEIMKRRLKPFPMHSDANGVSIYSPQRAPPVRPLQLSVTLMLSTKQDSSSPSPFSRAHSEPAVALQQPLSPSKSTFRQHSPFRASSHSPASNMKSLRSPDFDVYLQEEDTYRLDDHSVTFSVPPSPSGPPTTSGTSALPSNTSEMDSESDHSSILEMCSKDKKRLRALRRMMPAAMITRQLGNTRTVRSLPPRPRITTVSSGSEAEEVRLIPGLAKVRKGAYKNVEVRGDPESSDMEGSVEVDNDASGKGDAGLGIMEMLSDGESAVRVRRKKHTLPRIPQEDDVISLSDSSSPGSSSEESESGSNEENIHQSLFDRPERGPVRERSLIDWMLSRTRDTRRSKTKTKKPMGSRKSRGSEASRLNIVTSGARRYADRHQTRLPFVRVNSSSNATLSTRNNSGYGDQTVQLNQDTTDERKKRKKLKRQSRTHQGEVYNVHHKGTRITSRHLEGKSKRGKAALIFGEDDDHFRQALDPGWRAEVERWNKTSSPARQPAVNPTGPPTTSPTRKRRRRSSTLRSELPLPVYLQPEKEPSAFTPHHVSIDMNITPLPSGIKFSVSSYVGKGLLHQLVSITSGNSDVAPPISCNVQGFEIGPTTSAAVFSALLGPLCDRLGSALREFNVDDVGTMKEWESVMRASSQLLSWLSIYAEESEFSALEMAIQEYSEGLLLVLRSLQTTIFSLAVHWFVVEISARLATGIKHRRGSVENGPLTRSAKQLVQRLLTVDFHPAFATFYAAEGDVDITSLSHRVTELWICLTHLLPNFEISASAGAPGHPLWRLLADLHTESSPTGPDASEGMWRMIFSLCAISQFSVHGLSVSTSRLPAAWELVAISLKTIILVADPEKDRRLPRSALKKRDDYLSCVVSRCFLLWSQWKWRLDDGIIMFKSLHEIFRSRNFSNLLNEQSASMGFLENGDLELLSQQDPQDSVFEVFLKMVVQAVHLLNTNVALDPKQRSANIKKLLQIAVPVSPVPFSRSTPPSVHSLSMLVNRFSAMVVAAHLDPTPSNIKFRIGQARRCVSFRNADDQSRVACVYGMMNFAMIVRHHKIAGGLQEALEWLGEMADALMDEYKEGEASAVTKTTTTTLIQLLIGSVRRVIETQTLDKGQSRAEYPDPALLDGPWVTRVFNPRTDLVTIQQTGVEIRMLVQSFLDARLKAMPKARPPSPAVVHSAESQDSQDEYDKLFLDLNDEELLAALGGEAEASIVSELKLKEDALCKVLDKFITPAVYRLVCKHIGENEHAKNDAASSSAADEWIDCWVSCANVLVQNNYKDWGLYMKLGQQSWEKIIDDSRRRRVGLRFDLTLLRLDPGAYDKMKDDFIAVLFVATLSHEITIEHEFISLVLSLDGLQHPLLRGAPLKPIPGTRQYEVNEANYDLARGQIIETVFANVARCLCIGLDADSQAYAELVVTMLSTMRDIYQSVEEKAEYGEFCQRVFRALLSHAVLVSHPRMSDALRWGRGQWNL